MSEHSAEILNAICEIRELVRLLAEPAIAERDRKMRDDLRRIVGSSTQKSKSTLLMNGLRTQKDIRTVTGITSGNLSTFVKQLKDAGLVLGDGKQPALTISIPGNFFEAEGVIDRR